MSILQHPHNDRREAIPGTMRQTSEDTATPAHVNEETIEGAIPTPIYLFRRHARPETMLEQSVDSAEEYRLRMEESDRWLEAIRAELLACDEECDDVLCSTHASRSSTSDEESEAAREGGGYRRYPHLRMI